MRIGVFGAGAVGGYLAARLAKAGAHEVVVVARGEHGRAIAQQGLTLEDAGERITVQPYAVGADAARLPRCDLVFVTAKAHALPHAAEGIAALMQPHAGAVFACNGIPWWWHHGGAGPPLELLDPGARLRHAVQARRALGCVVYSANEVIAPGLVRHTANNRWVLGEPDGSDSARSHEAAAVLLQAGLHAERAPDIRREIWAKLLRNAALNSICALTRLPVGDLAAETSLLALCHAVVDEVAAVARAHGADVTPWIEAARQAPARGGAVEGAPAAVLRPSMLQDVLHRRRLEVEAVLGAVQVLARQAAVSTPCLDVLVPLSRGLDRGLR